MLKRGRRVDTVCDLEVIVMLMRTDPFRELDRLAGRLFGTAADGSFSDPDSMPMDAYRDGEQFVVRFDLPGVSPEAIELDVERSVLTVRAARPAVAVGEDVEVQVGERPVGVFSRQLFLGDTLDPQNIDADYSAGVLTLRIPIAPSAKPRKIAITCRGERRELTG
jgi:HSP20 family protein